MLVGSPIEGQDGEFIGLVEDMDGIKEAWNTR